MNFTHPNNLESSYVGDSVGHWEGRTLVVDTLGFNGYAELDARGQPTSPRLHTVERMTPAADGSSLDIEVTITDPEYYDRPFTIKRSWKRSAARHPFEYDCMENPRAEDFENAYYCATAIGQPACAWRARAWLCRRSCAGDEPNDRTQAATARSFGYEVLLPMEE